MHPSDGPRPRPSASAPHAASADAITPLRTPPRRVPHLGQILELADDDMRYRTTPLRLQVTEVRLEISQWYGGEWVWVEGHELDATNHPIAWQQALIRVAAITPATIR